MPGTARIRVENVTALDAVEFWAELQGRKRIEEGVGADLALDGGEHGVEQSVGNPRSPEDAFQHFQ